MTTRRELEELLASYESANGSGNLKQAGRILPKIVRALVSFVEERTPDHVEPTEEPGFIELLGRVFGDPDTPSIPLTDEEVITLIEEAQYGAAPAVEIAPRAPLEVVEEYYFNTESANDRPITEPCPPCEVTADSDLSKFGMTEELKAQLAPASKKKVAPKTTKPAPKTSDK